MNPADKGVFQKYFDPAGSGEIDEGFVKDVLVNYQRIRSYMSSLHFDCNRGAKTHLCGSSKGWCCRRQVDVDMFRYSVRLFECLPKRGRRL